MSSLLYVVLAFAAGFAIGGTFLFVWGMKHGKSLAAAEAKATAAAATVSSVAGKVGV